MPRYFFRLHVNGDVERDPIGVEVSDLAYAVNEATKARAELIDEEVVDELWLEIMDESGQVLAKVGCFGNDGAAFGFMH
jgi:hypothetical protein